MLVYFLSISFLNLPMVEYSMQRIIALSRSRGTCLECIWPTNLSVRWQTEC